MKFKKMMAVALAAVVAALALTACGSSNATGDATSTDAAQSANSDLAYIKDKGTLIVGITEYEPMNYKDKSGNWTGFDTEFAQAVAEKLGVTAEFKVIDWDNKFIELDAKSLDCIWNGMTITDEALNNASVSDPYVENAQVVVMKSSELSKYSKIEEMSELTFAAEAGSAGEKALKNAKMKNITAVSAQSDALMEVASGSADACVIDITMANSMTGEGTSYADLGYSIKLEKEEYGIAFRKDADTKDEVNKIMAELKSDGTLDALAKKYELTLVK